MTFAAWSDALAAMLDVLKIERSAFVGHSLGGMLAHEMPRGVGALRSIANLSALADKTNVHLQGDDGGKRGDNFKRRITANADRRYRQRQSRGRSRP